MKFEELITTKSIEITGLKLQGGGFEMEKKGGEYIDLKINRNTAHNSD